ncbi:hypothetical protein EWH99_11605 [Sporolactobacillus sp. THM7-7]|nr:hypothetical protein EWH99_11605 [Sporolactobacillus sp. THM7-7]
MEWNVTKSVTKKRASSEACFPMHIHYFQHVPFEKPGNIQEWAKARGYETSGTRFYHDELVPDIRNIDMLVVMGGPMNIL